MGEVDHDPSVIAGANQSPPSVRQTWTGVGRVVELEGDAMTVRVRPAPDRTKRSQPRVVERLERVEIGVNTLCSLDVQESRKDPLAQAALDVSSAAHDPYPAV